MNVFTNHFVSHINTYATPNCKNIYVALDGTLRPHKFPKAGLWKFDGQFYYLPKEVMAV
jgi:hypothetical protein